MAQYVITVLFQIFMLGVFLLVDTSDITREDGYAVTIKGQIIALRVR